MVFYTTKDLSNILCISVKSIQRLIRQHKIQAYRVGGRFLVEENELVRYLQDLTESGFDF